ncbi:hypothetical protein DFJ73DRAFT_846180 [Zopfochytrium polystomum]|nr:hypothetical protein DFJ73DRAFT_846180 [Zopfochytrium polystomum]
MAASGPFSTGSANAASSSSSSSFSGGSPTTSASTMSSAATYPSYSSVPGASPLHGHSRSLSAGSGADEFGSSVGMGSVLSPALPQPPVRSMKLSPANARFESKLSEYLHHLDRKEASIQKDRVMLQDIRQVRSLLSNPRAITGDAADSDGVGGTSSSSFVPSSVSSTSSTLAAAVARADGQSSEPTTDEPFQTRRTPTTTPAPSPKSKSKTKGTKSRHKSPNPPPVAPRRSSLPDDRGFSQYAVVQPVPALPSIPSQGVPSNAAPPAPPQPPSQLFPSTPPQGLAQFASAYPSPYQNYQLMNDSPAPTPPPKSPHQQFSRQSPTVAALSMQQQQSNALSSSPQPYRVLPQAAEFTPLPTPQQRKRQMQQHQLPPKASTAPNLMSLVQSAAQQPQLGPSQFNLRPTPSTSMPADYSFPSVTDAPLRGRAPSRHRTPSPTPAAPNALSYGFAASDSEDRSEFKSLPNSAATRNPTVSAPPQQVHQFSQGQYGGSPSLGFATADQATLPPAAVQQRYVVVGPGPPPPGAMQYYQPQPQQPVYPSVATRSSRETKRLFGGNTDGGSSGKSDTRNTNMNSNINVSFDSGKNSVHSGSGPGWFRRGRSKSAETLLQGGFAGFASAAAAAAAATTASGVPSRRRPSLDRDRADDVGGGAGWTIRRPPPLPDEGTSGGWSGEGGWG